MVKRIKEWLKRIRHNRSLESCYKSMEYQGNAVFGMCSGVVGGDRSTEYLSINCIDCPYYVLHTGSRDKRK